MTYLVFASLMFPITCICFKSILMNTLVLACYIIFKVI